MSSIPYIILYVLWHVDSLIDNDRETNNKTTTATMQRPRKQQQRNGVFCLIHVDML
jgi:hypothetical protein